VLIEDNRSMTYREWNDCADRLAQGLIDHGLYAGDIIVARTRNRIEWAIIASAVGKIGARLLIQNWRLTPAETRYVLENARADAFICDDPDPAALGRALEGLCVKLQVSIDVAAPGFARFDALFTEAAAPRFACANPPLVVYTSGTTGFPKGVEMPRPNPPLALSKAQPRQEAGAGLVNMPVHHGSGPNQIWNYLASGRRIVLMRHFDPEQTLALIEKHRITHWSGVPTMYKRISGLPDSVVLRYDLSSLQAISIGAAPCAWSLKAWILEIFGEILSEGYGSTETGMITSMPPNMQRKKPGSSGLAYPNVEIEIRNGEGRKTPANTEGDIWVRSPLTIENYINAPKLAADTRDAAGFFKVGDIGRIDEDGYLFITDRAKDLIISGGVNIYPAEVETALLSHPCVQDVAVLGAPNDDFGEEVWAYVELKPGRSVTQSDLLAHAAPLLADYKRPRHIVFIAELPRNTMGKVLKRELREPLWAGREGRI
jgi:long-chain acyl-CoA synthetase